MLADLPGWGGSTRGARPEHLSLGTASRAVAGILASLGYRRWNLMGHSRGFLALHIAAVRHFTHIEQPDHVHRLLNNLHRP